MLTKHPMNTVTAMTMTKRTADANPVATLPPDLASDALGVLA